MTDPEPSSTISVLMDTTPLNTAHAIRGIGAYTRLLSISLEKLEDVELFRSSSLGETKPKIDLIHYPFFDLFFATLPLYFGKPSVITIHDLIPLKYPEYYPAGIKGKLNFERQKLILKKVGAVITDSHSSKNDIVNFLGLPEEKVHVIYLAPNPELKALEVEEARKILRKYKLPKKYLLYVGDINYNKNITQLIKTLKFLPKDVSLVCVGKNFVEQDIPEWRWIETQIALSDVKDRVWFLTNVMTDDVLSLSALYSGAICYLQPSLWEGFGLPVLEAMRCRTPVISSNQGSLPEVGGDYALYSEPKAEFFAERVEEVLGWSKTKRSEFVRSAFAWSQNFFWEKTAQETAEVYKGVLK